MEKSFRDDDRPAWGPLVDDGKHYYCHSGMTFLPSIAYVVLRTGYYLVLLIPLSIPAPRINC